MGSSDRRCVMTRASTGTVIGFILTILVAMSPGPATAELVYVFATFTDGGTMAGTFQLDRFHRRIDFFSIATTSGSVLDGFDYESAGQDLALASYVDDGVARPPLCNKEMPAVVSFQFQITGPLAHTMQFSVPDTSIATFAGGDITTACFAYEGAGFTVRNIANGHMITDVSAETGLGLAIAANQPTFAVGQVLRPSASINDPGLGGSADFYLGVVLPDRVTVVFWTGGSSTAVGRLHDLQTYRPYARGIPLAMPFSVSLPDFLPHQWTGTEPRGTYVLINLATRAGGLADGAIAGGDVLGIATAPFTFP